MRINKIWEELENDGSFSSGLLLRRYSGSVLPNVFVGLRAPGKFRCIAASLSDKKKIDIQNYLNLRDISVEMIPDERKPESNIIIFKLLNDQHKDIFSALCEDLISGISAVTDEAKLILELLNRFEKWKSLFDKLSLEGLGPEEQRGLYGELFFIRKFLQNNTNHSGVVNSWIGCSKEARDFQFGSWGVEVKTTCGNNHQKIHVSSERQLDTKNVRNLFLFHISMEEAQQSGETLSQVISSITKILNSDLALLGRFNNKLLEAGYFNHHRHIYENRGYMIRQEAFYAVENEFPRIEERDVRSGVGDVKYTIILSGCTKFIRPNQEVFNILQFPDE